MLFRSDSRRSARCQKISNEKEGMNAKLSQQYTTAKSLVECDHLNLNCCFDFSYFLREYIVVRQKKNHKLRPVDIVPQKTMMYGALSIIIVVQNF